MNNAPAVFAFDSQAVRVIQRNGEPWFVAADVCSAIGIANSRDAIEKLDEDEKGVGLTDTPGGKQEMVIVSESGLYTLILRSRNATTPGTVAHRFRKWVTAEVLPSIRKTGAYAAPGVPRRDDPLSISHRADIFVGADRVFRATMRAARTAGMTTAAAIRRAQAVALDRTGIDMLAELGLPEPEGPPAVAMEEDPGGVCDFAGEWSGGGLGLPFTVCGRHDLYTAYLSWASRLQNDSGKAVQVVSEKTFAGLIQTALLPGRGVRPMHINVCVAGQTKTLRAWVPICAELDRQRVGKRTFDTRECERFRAALRARLSS